MLVLLVEDHEDTRDAMVMYLKVYGIQTETADAGQQVLSMATRLIPDVVVMDLGLPGMNGWEATRQLKSEPRTAHLPIIALSAHASATDEEQALEVGCAAYLRKPCLPSDLLATILRVAPAR